MSELVQLSRERGVARILLDRPESRNALSLPMIRRLSEVVAEVDALARSERDSPRVAVLAGAGKVFCAGMDLKQVAADPVQMGEMLRELSRTLRALRRLPIPTISLAHGAAIGGGCGLAIVCDFCFTHAEAKLGYPEVDLGICPAVVAPWLVQRIGAGPARALLLAGGVLTGAEAHRAGLVTHLAPQAELERAGDEWADRLAKGGPRSLAATKRWLNELDGSNDDEIAERAASISAAIIAGPEAQERLRRFFSTLS
ncbi:MAG: enoyl-CoA hydratase/isomerase family protein [Phycisphaerae bacterium]|nr:enoyl-CoA hydratase/isomerase family protein [Phycisphaerae bacterium]